MMDRELIVTKKTLQAASAAHSLHTNYGIKQALGAAEQGANLQTLVKTSLNVATTEILLYCLLPLEGEECKCSYKLKW